MSIYTKVLSNLQSKNENPYLGLHALVTGLKNCVKIYKKGGAWRLRMRKNLFPSMDLTCPLWIGNPIFLVKIIIDLSTPMQNRIFTMYKNVLF